MIEVIIFRMKLSKVLFLRSGLDRYTIHMILIHKILIAKISVTSPIVINVPTRELLAGETKSSFV